MSGVLVTLEGCDAAGKGVISRRVSAALRGLGFAVTATSEPTAGPIGNLIRDALERRVVLAGDAMGPLFAADRADHIAQCVMPAIVAGRVVLCDRFDGSNIAYRTAEADGPLFACASNACDWTGDDVPAEQHIYAASWRCPSCKSGSVYLTKVAAARLAWAVGLTHPDAPQPDLTVVLDVPLDVAEARRLARGDASELYDATPMQRRVRAIYKAWPHLMPQRRIVIVDANRDVDVVADDVLRHALSVIDP